MAKVEILANPYAFGREAKRGDVVDVPADKVGALRRLGWVREIEEPPAEASAPTRAARPRKVQAVEKEPDVDGSISET